MYADEYRAEELSRQQRIKLETSDPERLYNKYIGLVERERRSKNQAPKIDPMLSQKEQLWEIEKHDLKRRVPSAHSALNSTKEDNTRLRKQITAIRNSNTMKVGRTVTAPVRSARQSSRQIKLIGRKVLSKISSTLNFSKSNAKVLAGSQKQITSLTSTVPDKQEPTTVVQKAKALTAQQNTEHVASAPKKKQKNPIEVFEASPNLKNFEKTLNFHWYNLGSISGAQEFIESNPKFAEQASDKTTILIKRIAGDFRLMRNGVQLPERSEGVAYLAEPERIMYTVHQTPSFNSNGYSTRTHGVANGIIAAGGDVVVVGRSGYPWDSRVDRNKPAQERFVDTIDEVTYIHNPGPNLNSEALDDYMNEVADTFVREARLCKPSTIQSASNFRTAIPALIAARRIGVPFVYEVRGLWEFTEASAKPGFENTERFDQMKNLETFVAKNADRVLAITRQVAAELVERGVDADRISILPNAVDPSTFVPIPKDRKYVEAKKFSPDIPAIGFAGSFVGYEGLDLLIEASARLTEENVAHQVVLAGSGTEEENLKALSTKLNLKNIHFLGRLPQNEIVRLMSTFDIVACPRTSTVVTELVSPLKPLESFATCTATVVSDVSPNRDLAGEPGVFQRALQFQAGNTEALAASLRTLIENEDLRRDLGRTSRLWVIRERNWKQIGTDIRREHRAAGEFYVSNTVSGRELKNIKVGVIADEFTRVSLQATFDAVIIDRAIWRNQISTQNIDFLFVESAWEGNGGQWHRGVGYYGEVENTDLFELLDECNQKSIPTVFWNKEDPVHFQRFEKTAARFDHVFTTDANMIQKYRALEGSRNITVSSHSFYSQPSVHNPLPTEREFSPTVAYAGTYYGDRYKDRSKRLDALLQSSYEYGLDIFDRQANNPDSPYKFPAKFQRFVRGALPYEEVIKTYKSHLAHMNVNSVENSPTMFSRRVVEIPASGGILMSAEGRGITETLGSVLATSNDKRMYTAWLNDWATNPNAWFAERWMQMRAVFRAHTSSTALSILARTVGIPSTNPGLPDYALECETLDASNVQKILTFSVRPAAIIIEKLDEDLTETLMRSGVSVVKNASTLDAHVEWIGRYNSEVARTFYEDLLSATTYGEWAFLDAVVAEIDSYAAPLASPTTEKPGQFALSRTSNHQVMNEAGITLLMPLPSAISAAPVTKAPRRISKRPDPKVLIAGHDLKFINGFIDHLRSEDINVETDTWAGHNLHEEAESQAKLENSDIIICEWGLGNAVWYSRNVSDHQKLIVRVHSQELFLPYLSQIDHDRVDAYIFVGELIRKAAVISHGVPEHKTRVIPNSVDTTGLDLPKDEESAHTIGLVGIIPRSKRLDLALDLVDELHKHGASYKLRIKGKMPSDYPWMKNRLEELEFYDKQFARIDKINAAHPGSVVMDGYGNDMPEWFQKIGIALSSSDFESFHFTLADGGASGALPISLNWPGADLIYPESWLSGSIAQMAQQILNDRSQEDQSQAKEEIVSKYNIKKVFSEMRSLLFAD
ncbi:hypothetical protein C627_02135 [Corynebacterium glutamicum ZL-6]|uniref:glycosyltransferase n=1 Tax=Corynebacterium TaxID=1716 RepID=UPI0008079665|nr:MULTISPECIES: glycosyltransferase [Corynebacterium]ANR61417.1 hypothetical protein C628_02135 [[Brevibacterium] flavum ZL-1]ANR64417.1 hypothetical protein C627_02135 [Corynebacterium glutamicum ZL-6]PST76976.1 hypothetical protein I919_02177 [Corynebacterium glutamicum ZL-2]